MNIQIGRWGKNLAIRIPRELENRLDLKEGQALSAEALESALDSIRRQRVARRFAAIDRQGQALTLPKGWKFDRDEANAR